MLLINANLPPVALMYPNNPQQQQAQPSSQWSDRPQNSPYPPPPGPPEYGAPPNPQAHRPTGSMTGMPAIPPQPDYRMAQVPMDPYQQDPYCRRRKIRCSGFENAPDGRCGNCSRFNQECIFTPVASQAQAFVPAHTAYPHLRGGVQTNRGRGYGPPPLLYGAHGQPLGQVPPPAAEGYPPDYGRAPSYAYHYEERPGDQGPSGGGPMQRRTPPGEYGYRPDPNNLPPVSPSGSAVSYQSAYAQPNAPTNGYAQQSPSGPPHRSSPQSGYCFESQPSPQYPNQPGLHPPQALPPRQPSHTPPPPQGGQSGSSRNMSIQNMLGNPAPERTAADSSMLNALNRSGPA
ncbi:MAG: hypothetical protein M1814_002249 [Vezdaea aestivalis]|nr:MAG: hypothetical protein M1814_002249 [Vezdaea aestivalis]